MSRHSDRTSNFHDLRRQVLAEEPCCWLCGHPIDMTLSGRHPDGPTVDHVIPRSQGGTTTRENLRAAHQRCNSRRQHRQPARLIGQTSRPW